MIQGQWFSPGKDISSLIPVRRAVFGRGGDEMDPESWNALVYEDDIPVATGRIWYRNGVYWLGDIGVLESHRCRHLGDLVLRLLLFKAQSHAASEVRLLCPDDTVGFFTRLGFIPVSETGNPMEMYIEGSHIELDSCKSCKKPDCPNRR